MVYLYNPFTGLLFARFIERLLRSLERRPRPLRLIYNYPFEHNYVIETGRFGRSISPTATGPRGTAGPGM